MEHAHRKPGDYEFSIIVPVLNKQGQINSFIDKIKGQGFDDNYEIIIVDGDRQAAVARHTYAPENLAIGFFSKGADVVIKEVKAWEMKSSYGIVY